MHKIYAGLSTSENMLILVFLVYWSVFLDFVFLLFAKSYSLSVKSKAQCKQDLGMECGWGFLSAKFLLPHAQLLKT